MIQSVHFENFRSLRAVDLNLGRLTVLVGPNGCGGISAEGTNLICWARGFTVIGAAGAGQRNLGATP